MNKRVLIDLIVSYAASMLGVGILWAAGLLEGRVVPFSIVMLGIAVAVLALATLASSDEVRRQVVALVVGVVAALLCTLTVELLKGWVTVAAAALLVVPVTVGVFFLLRASKAAFRRELRPWLAALPHVAGRTIKAWLYRFSQHMWVYFALLPPRRRTRLAWSPLVGAFALLATFGVNTAAGRADWFLRVTARSLLFMPDALVDAVSQLLSNERVAHALYGLAAGLYAATGVGQLLCLDPMSASGSLIGALIFGVGLALCMHGKSVGLPVLGAALWALFCLVTGEGWNHGGHAPFVISRIGLMFVLLASGSFFVRAVLTSRLAAIPDDERSLWARAAWYAAQSSATSWAVIIATSFTSTASVLEIHGGDYSLLLAASSMLGATAFWVGTVGFASAHLHWRLRSA